MAIRKIFLSVGAMKAGTTFLYSALKDHPDLHFTPEKELHFFAEFGGLQGRLNKPLIPNLKDQLRRTFSDKREFLSKEFRIQRMRTVLKNRYRNVDKADKIYDAMLWYTEKYLSDPIDEKWYMSAYEGLGDRYACDFSNYNALLDDNSWSYIKSLADELKVIYILRHPVERLWSHIKFHYVQSGRADELHNLSQKDVRALLKNADMSSHARYGHIVESLQKNLSESQLKIVCFEELVSQFQQSMFSLETFLDIEHLSYKKIDPNRRINAGNEMQIPPYISQEIRKAVRPELEKLTSLKIDFPAGYFD
jgi:hypothetical protein